jgi:hypothetical protein
MTIRIVNLRTKPTPSYDIYIGRANKWHGLSESKWHNPFPLKLHLNRYIIINRYKEYILGRPDLLADLGELDGKILACWCHNDEPNHPICHGDILRELFLEQNNV